MKNKAIFFDRDGIVNYRIVDIYIDSFKCFKFIPDFLYFFKEIKKSGWLSILTTNQKGVGKGLMTIIQLEEVHKQMQNELKNKTGFCFDDISYCIELPSSNSYRLKPNPGMVIEAIEKWDIEAASSWMIGDRASDVIAGKRGGLNTILIGNLKMSEIPEADFVYKNLYDAYDKKFSKF